MNDRIIIMFTYSPFPYGAAASNRIYSLALSFQMIGYKVIVLSNGGRRNEDFHEINEKYIFNGVEYRDFSKTNISKLKRIYNRLNIYKLIKDNFTNDEIDKVGFIYLTYRNYGIIPYLLLRLMKITSIVDATEWHSSEQFLLSKFNLKYIIHNTKMRYFVQKSRNIVCISEYLENYYKTKKCNTVRIPPQVNVLDFNRNKMNLLPPIKLIYGGTAAKKDYIDVALDGLCLLSDQELKRIEFTLVGLNMDAFISEFPNAEKYIEKLQKSLVILDKMPKQDFDKVLSDSHFLILLRPISRYSQAGFPSKVPEALAAGLPVITNYTSDLSKYIKNDINGYIVRQFTADEFRNTIREILSIQHQDFIEMSEQAFLTAKRFFNYDVHVNDLELFLNRAHIKVRR